MPRSMESLPIELVEGIGRMCDARDLKPLAQTSRWMRQALRKELAKKTFFVVCSDEQIVTWVQGGTGPYIPQCTSLQIGLGGPSFQLSVEDGPNISMLNRTRPRPLDQKWHALDIFALPSGLREIQLIASPSPHTSRIFNRLLSTIADRCPQLVEITLTVGPWGNLDGYDSLGRLRHLRKVYVTNMPSGPEAIPLPTLPRQIEDLQLDGALHYRLKDLEVCLSRMGNLRKLIVRGCPPGWTGRVLGSLARAEARNLRDITIMEDPEVWAPAEKVKLPGKELTEALKAFGQLGAPISSMYLECRGGWDAMLHLSLLHQAVSATLRRLELRGMPDCRFPGGMVWPRLIDLTIEDAKRTGVVGPVVKPIFPRLETLRMALVGAYEGREYGDMSPDLQRLRLRREVPPEVTRCVVQHDLSRLIFQGAPDGGVAQHLDTLRGVSIEYVSAAKWSHFKGVRVKPDAKGKLYSPSHLNVKRIDVGEYGR